MSVLREIRLEVRELVRIVLLVHSKVHLAACPFDVSPHSTVRNAPRGSL